MPCLPVHAPILPLTSPASSTINFAFCCCGGNVYSFPCFMDFSKTVSLNKRHTHTHQQQCQHKSFQDTFCRNILLGFFVSTLETSKCQEIVGWCMCGYVLTVLLHKILKTKLKKLKFLPNFSNPHISLVFYYCTLHPLSVAALICTNDKPYVDVLYLHQFQSTVETSCECNSLLPHKNCRAVSFIETRSVRFVEFTRYHSCSTNTQQERGWSNRFLRTSRAEYDRNWKWTFKCWAYSLVKCGVFVTPYCTSQ